MSLEQVIRNENGCIDPNCRICKSYALAIRSYLLEEIGKLKKDRREFGGATLQAGYQTEGYNQALADLKKVVGEVEDDTPIDNADISGYDN